MLYIHDPSPEQMPVVLLPVLLKVLLLPVLLRVSIPFPCLPSVNQAGADILKMTLHSCLINSMGISSTTVSKMVTSKIWQHEVTYLNMIVVEFSNMRSVSTIFKHVKNLLPGQKVSIFIPDVLDMRS